MMWQYRLAFIILLTGTSALAQIRGLVHHSDSSRSTVSTYCRMDYDGGRLANESWARMKRLTTWKDNPDWLGFTVISQYDILSADERLRGASVQVQYLIVGRFERGLGYTAEPGREDVSFKLKDVESEWKIEGTDPSINPHVSKARAVAWLKSALATEKDAGSKIALEKALNDLGAKP